MSLNPTLLASIQHQRTEANLLAAAIAFGIVENDDLPLTDTQWNLTLEALDKAHPGWRFYGANVCQFHDVYHCQDAA